MAAKPETKFWKKLKKKLPLNSDVIRVENPACPGTPDVNMCTDGVETWPELKQVAGFPKRETTPVFTGALRADQVLWHIRRSRAGGRSYIVGYVESEDKIYVIPGAMADDFNSMTRAQLEEHNLPLEELWTPH